MDFTAALDTVIDDALETRIVGCNVVVLRAGRQVYRRSAGFADREAKVPVRDDTIFRLASLTKPIVASCVLRMVDLGLLSLDDAVDRYLPFFRPKAPDGGTPTILIRHLLTHTSGLTYQNAPDDVSRGSDPKPLIPLEENLRRLARGELAFAPGTRWDYGTSIDVLGGVIGAINGDISNVEAVLQKHLLGPLGMTDTLFGVRDPARLAVAYGDGEPVPLRMAEPQRLVRRGTGDVAIMSPQRIFEPTAPQSGGSGLAGSAGDFLKLLEAVVHGDFLKPETRKAALGNQIGTLQRPDTTAKFGFLGAVVVEPERWMRPGMVQWGGIWGHSWTVDPTSGTTLLIATNTMWEGCNGPFVDEVGQAVFGAVAAG
jgi:CubicO group peptidase (beta-lactamase class C family)